MDPFTQLITQHGYLLLFPLATIEGPLVALAAGFFVSIGYLQVVPAFLILILGDVIPDCVYYYIGRFGNYSKVMKKYGKRLAVITDNFYYIERLWQEHGRKTMFLAKLAYGLSIPFIVSAGLAKLPFKKFISYTIPPTLFQYGVIMAAGYYLGNSYQLAETYIIDAGTAVAIFLLALVAFSIAVSYYARRGIIKTEQKTELENKE